MLTTITPWVLAICSVAANPRATVVTFQTKDGVDIVADYYPPPAKNAPVVILLHMYGADRKSWQPLIHALSAGARFAVLAIDWRGSGDSIHPKSMLLREQMKDRDPNFYNEMDRDVSAAYAYLATSKADEVDLSRFGIVGASVGCSIALDYAAMDKSVDIIVCLSPGENYMAVNSIEHIKAYGDRPILLIASKGERDGADALVSVSPKADISIVGRGKIHGTQMFERLKNMDGRIMSYLHNVLGHPSGKRVVASIDGEEYFEVGSDGHEAIASDKVRWFSSASEAESRGLRAGKATNAPSGTSDKSAGNDAHR
jgi:pimeloyl-ACP methyl ester carboxylesterase